MRQFFKKFFKCKFNNSKCQNNFFGCQCGVVATSTAILTAAAIGAATAGVGMYQANKAQKSAKSLAEQQANEAKAEQQRLEEKYGILTPEEKEREQRTFALEKERQTELTRRAGLSGEELLAEVGPTTKNLLDILGSRLGMTGEELYRREGPTAVALADQILAETKEPTKYYEGTLVQELELARQMVNKEANRRGVFEGLPEGGIKFEQLGRSAIDLAIKSAQAKTAYRRQSLSNAVSLLNQYQSLSAGARTEAGTMAEKGLSEQERSRAELDQFLANIENLTESAKGRITEAATGASQIASQQIARSYDTLQTIQGQKAAQAGALGAQGADLLKEAILASTEKTPTPTGQLTLSDLIKQPNYDPKKRLADLTGASMFNTGNLTYSGN